MQRVNATLYHSGGFPFGGFATTFAPVGSVSHDSQVASAPLRIVFPCHPAEAVGLWVLGSSGNGDYDSNGYNGVCRRQAAHILIAEGDTTPSEPFEPFEPSRPKGVSMPSRRLVFITDCLKCGMHRDSSPTAQNDCARREIP